MLQEVHCSEKSNPMWSAEWGYRTIFSGLASNQSVLKSLIISQLVYILSPLPTDQRVVNEVNNLCYNFLWDGKGDKIKRDTMISDYEQGGLKMVDVKIFSKALKATWIKKYLDQNNHAKWKLFFDLQLQDLGGATFFRGNLNQKDLLKVGKVSDVFLQEILQIWSEVTFEDCMSHACLMHLCHPATVTASLVQFSCTSRK